MIILKVKVNCLGIKLEKKLIKRIIFLRSRRKMMGLIRNNKYVVKFKF